MSDNHLRRHLAPLSEAAWQQVDDEARRCLSLYLAGRRVVDVQGPVGWDVDAVTQGIASAAASPGENVQAAVRQPLPMLELRTPFRMSLADLDNADRGNQAINTSAVIAAAQAAARAEDAVILNGVDHATGLISATPSSIAVPSPDSVEYAFGIARAVDILRAADIAGPYALVVGEADYTQLVSTTEQGGYPLLEHVTSILGGPVHWAPLDTRGVVVSLRGGDFVLTLGQDLSIGFAAWTGDEVDLYLEESIALQVLTPNAAVALTS